MSRELPCRAIDISEYKHARRESQALAIYTIKIRLIYKVLRDKTFSISCSEDCNNSSISCS